MARMPLTLKVMRRIVGGSCRRLLGWMSVLNECLHAFKKERSTPLAGFEPAISSLEGKRLIHWAIGACENETWHPQKEDCCMSLDRPFHFTNFIEIPEFQTDI